MSSILLSIRSLRVTRNGIAVLNLPALDVRQGEILAIIGPNGAGKTTLMMAISGLIPIQAGEMVFQGKRVAPNQDLSYRRKLALVMQAPLLLHTSVYENIASGLKFRGVPAKEARIRIEDWLDKLYITHLKDRQAQRLSGGEAQRVSLARALVLTPDLILLDEPFSALDAPTRSQLLADLKKLLAMSGITAIFITHDLDEALSMADRVVVLMNGQLRQIGTPREVFSTPADPEIARFTGVETILSGQVRSIRDGLAEIDCGAYIFQAVSDAAVGSSVYLCLRPEDITLARPPAGLMTSARNVLTGRIELLIPQGPLVRVVFDGAVPLTALITRASAQEMELAVGQEIQASFKASAVHITPQ